MSTIKKSAQVAAMIGVAAAATVALAAPAQAATPGTLNARLSIAQKGASECTVTISGNVGMDPAQARYLIDNGARAEVVLYADDPIFDNRLQRLYDANLFAGSAQNGNGLIIQAVEKVSCEMLNEDNALPSGETDEIYAKVTFRAPGYTTMTKQTNTVTNTFGFA